MSKTLVIGGAGLIGARVVEALGEERCIRASRNSGERVDISDPKSLAALFERAGRPGRDRLHGRSCAIQAVGPADRRGLDVFPRQQTDGAGQRRALRREDSPARRRNHAYDWSRGAISRSRERDHHHQSTPPSKPSCARRPRSHRFPCGSTRSRRAGSPRRCKRWAAIRRAEFRRRTSRRSSCASFARARQARSRRPPGVEAGATTSARRGRLRRGRPRGRAQTSATLRRGTLSRRGATSTISALSKMVRVAMPTGKALRSKVERAAGVERSRRGRPAGDKADLAMRDVDQAVGGPVEHRLDAARRAPRNRRRPRSTAIRRAQATRPRAPRLRPPAPDSPAARRRRQSRTRRAWPRRPAG